MGNMTTIQLQQTVLQEVVSLMDNEKAMQKLQRFLSKLKQKEEANAKAEEMTAAEKEEILNDIREGLRELKLNDIREGLRELKLAREGKLKPRPIEELLHEL